MAWPLDSQGRVYAADDAYEQIDLIDPASGGNISSLGAGTLAQPVGVAVDGNGIIYVTDENLEPSECLQQPQRRFQTGPVGHDHRIARQRSRKFPNPFWDRR